jgi:hypothetical protein
MRTGTLWRYSSLFGLLITLSACTMAADKTGTQKQAPLGDMPTADYATLVTYSVNVRDNDLQWPKTRDDFAQLATVDFPCAACLGGYAHFLVVPTKNAKNLDWKHVLKESTAHEAEIVAAFVNLDSADFAEGHLTAGDVMYLWVGHIAGTDGRGIGLFSLDAANRKKWMVSGTKEFFLCTDPKHPRPKSSVKSNPGHPCPSTPETASGGPLNFAAFSLRYPSNLWISCSSGCCQSSPQRVVSTSLPSPTTN